MAWDWRKYRARLMAEGRCVFCGEDKHGDTRQCCQTCRMKHKRYASARPKRKGADRDALIPFMLNAEQQPHSDLWMLEMLVENADARVLPGRLWQYGPQI